MTKRRLYVNIFFLVAFVFGVEIIASPFLVGPYAIIFDLIISIAMWWKIFNMCGAYRRRKEKENA